MPAHGNYTNGAVTIIVNEANSQITYRQDGGGNHAGHLDYTLTATTLDIHAMNADPARNGLGALLLWFAANTASFHQKPTIQALSTARPAIPFYAAMGFTADPTELATAMAALTSAGPLAAQPHECVATWTGPTGAILNASFASITGRWNSV